MSILKPQYYGRKNIALRKREIIQVTLCPDFVYSHWFQGKLPTKEIDLLFEGKTCFSILFWFVLFCFSWVLMEFIIRQVVQSAQYQFLSHTVTYHT